jgi:hypothetical protein
MTGSCIHGIPWDAGCTLCGRNTLPGVNLYNTTCVHGLDLRLVPRCYLCKPELDLSAVVSGTDYTDLLLLIAECLVVLAWRAEPDAGARQSRLHAIRAAKETP